MSGKVFQSIIYQIHETLRRQVGVMDRNGTVLACSDQEKVGEVLSEAAELLNAAGGEPLCVEGYCYCPVGRGTSFFAFLEGAKQRDEELCAMVSVSLAGIKEMYDERYDIAVLVKNIILDNILPTDIYTKTREISPGAPSAFVPYLIKFGEEATELSPYDIVREVTGRRITEEAGMPSQRGEIYIVAAAERDIVLVRTINGAGASVDDELAEIEKYGQVLANIISVEFSVRVNIGIGSRANNIRELARARKEAQLSIEVGRVFDSERVVCCYDNLGIGRLIYQLPVPLCEAYLAEVFRKCPLEQIDRETLETIQFFFDNNLNVSESSRKLFIHRNTLVYRLDKLRRTTGMDLREFEDAITFKMALMIKKYMSTKRK